MRNLLNKPVFEKIIADWVSELPSVIKKFINTFHSSTKKTPADASKESNQKVVFSHLRDKSPKQKPKFKIGDSVRMAEIEKSF